MTQDHTATPPSINRRRSPAEVFHTLLFGAMAFAQPFGMVAFMVWVKNRESPVDELTAFHDGVILFCALVALSVLAIAGIVLSRLNRHAPRPLRDIVFWLGLGFLPLWLYMIGMMVHIDSLGGPPHSFFRW